VSTMQAEVFDALRSIGITDEKASAAAQALSKHDPDMGTLKADVSTLKADVSTLKVDVATLKTDMAVGKWMLGFIAAGIFTLLLKAFVH